VNALEFPVLSDFHNDVARQFRLIHRIDPEAVHYVSFNGTEEADAPLPAS
jgi:hypothetical protein